MKAEIKFINKCDKVRVLKIQFSRGIKKKKYVVKYRKQLLKGRMQKKGSEKLK